MTRFRSLIPFLPLTILRVSAAAVDAGIATSSLFSSNPTAIPLESINPSQASVTTQPLDATPSPGSSSRFLSGAPPLPDISAFNADGYPTMDKVPPTDSSEVQQWIAEVKNSSIPVPEFAPTNGSCTTGNLSNDSTCWWTCTRCTRSSDITTCPDKNVWGLSFDDGPGPYTSSLLKYLDDEGLKATFFVLGSRAVQFPDVLQEEYMSGHQIAVHTWSHPMLTTLTDEEIIAELGWSKKIIKDLLGVTPTMMRPPYGDIDDRVRNISLAMGLTPVLWTSINVDTTFDTQDSNLHSGGTTSSEVLSNWNQILTNASSVDTGFISLQHDIFLQTVEMATGYILPDAIASKLDIKPIISCLHKDLDDAYAELVTDASSGASAGSSASGPTASSQSGVTTTSPSRATVIGAVTGSLAALILLAACARFIYGRRLGRIRRERQHLEIRSFRDSASIVSMRSRASTTMSELRGMSIPFMATPTSTNSSEGLASSSMIKRKEKVEEALQGSQGSESSSVEKVRIEELADPFIAPGELESTADITTQPSSSNVTSNSLYDPLTLLGGSDVQDENGRVMSIDEVRSVIREEFARLVNRQPASGSGSGHRRAESEAPPVYEE